MMKQHRPQPERCVDHDPPPPGTGRGTAHHPDGGRRGRTEAPTRASRRNRGRIGVVSAVVALLALTACTGDPGRIERTEAGLARLAIDFSPTANNAQLTLGVERGIFARHGIEIDQRPGTGASAGAVALLLNGQIQLAVSEITAIPTAAANGFDVDVVTSLAVDYETPAGDASALVVPETSPIRSFADLEGRTVAVNGLRSFFDLTVLEAVRLDGGDPERVSVVAIPFEDQVAALRQGRVDAISTLQPFAGVLTRDGFRSVGNPAAAALGPHSVTTVLMGAGEFVEANPDVVRRFLTALAEAGRYANEHPDEVRRTIIETTGAPAEAIAQMPVPWYITGIQRPAAERTVDLMARYGRIDDRLPLGEFVWAGSPDATLTEPPRDLAVTR
ncbi:ABC transporter substrate-binding protein [Nocardia carnea]|uniref:ABC transporter substrate-binding protein n=1 Tax=Nocardia carnea TaxID=37328 RepID=UPI002455B744|nr:ABC transporter substrate-binding protein [Nocardia carnea]